MLLKRATLEGIRDGAITLVFRRWKRPTVRAGGTLRTRIGVLAIDAVDAVSTASITAEQASRAGSASRAALLRELATREGDTYRITVRLAGEDPRIALRKKRLSAAGRAEVRERLDRIDRASPSGAWKPRRPRRTLSAASPAGSGSPWASTSTGHT